MAKFGFILLSTMISFAAWAAGEVRVDLYGSKNLKLQHVEVKSPLKWKRFPANVGTAREETGALIISTPLTSEWSEFEISFIPEKNGLVAVNFHTPGSRNTAAIKPVLISNVAAAGSGLKNGNFSKVRNGKPEFWKLGAQGEFVAAENAVKVFYNKGRASQLFTVIGGQKVTLTFKAKLAE